MSVPAITITGTLQDIFGVADANGSLLVQLAGFGAAIPRVSGTSFVAKVAPSAVNCPAGTFSFSLWGNDVITPTGTYYVIQVLDDAGNVVQVQCYQFTGSGTFDLSTVAPYNPPTPALTVPNPVLLNPAGLQTINGSIVITGNLTVQGSANFPFGGKTTVAFSATPQFDANAGREFDMTLTGNVTSSTFVNGAIGPYLYKLTQDGTGGRTFVWPANVKGGGVPDTTAGAVNVQQFWWDGSNLTATGPMISY